MRRRSRLRASLRSAGTTSAVLLSGCSVIGAIGTPSAPCPPTPGQQIVSLLSTTRAREKLPQLRVDSRLARAAQAHAEDMASGGYSGHEGSDGSLPADRADRVSYPWTFVAENTAAGQSTASFAFGTWMASPPHRANNLLVDAEHVGVGYAENGDTQYRTYWVVLFGRSHEAPFTPSGGCRP